jgi:hypothetical protein
MSSEFLLRNRYLPLHRRLILIHKYPQESQGRKLFLIFFTIALLMR